MSEAKNIWVVHLTSGMPICAFTSEALAKQFVDQENEKHQGRPWFAMSEPITLLEDLPE